jgi:hypothetical protein
MKTDIKSMFLHELEDYFKSAGQQKFRAKQVFSWLHAGARSFNVGVYKTMIWLSVCICNTHMELLCAFRLK